MAQPLPISVIIAAYNAERFLGTALESVARQTRKPTEVIVVDDGSGDRTAEVAEARGVLVIRLRNGGAAAARNAGICAAKNAWIAFLDADDLWHPTKLERQWEAAELTQGDFIVTDSVRLYSDGTQSEPRLVAKHRYRNVRRVAITPGVVTCDPDDFTAAFLEECLLNTSTVLIKRQLLLAAGLFQPGFFAAEDSEMWLRVLRLASVAVVERPLAAYRFHDQNLTGDLVKVGRGFETLVAKVRSAPEQYPSRAGNILGGRLHRKLRILGIWAARSGDLEGASVLLKSSLAARFSFRAVALYALCRGFNNRAGKKILGSACRAWRTFRGTNTGLFEQDSAMSSSTAAMMSSS